MRTRPSLHLVLGVLAGGTAFLLTPLLEVDPAVSLVSSLLIAFAKFYWGGSLTYRIFSAPLEQRRLVHLGLLMGGLLSLLVLVWDRPAWLTLRLAVVPLVYCGAAGTLPLQTQRRKVRHALFGVLGGVLLGVLLGLFQGEQALDVLIHLPFNALLFGLFVWAASVTASFLPLRAGSQLSPPEHLQPAGVRPKE